MLNCRNGRFFACAQEKSENGLLKEKPFLTGNSRLIKPMQVTRHYFWANFFIPDMKLPPPRIDQSSNTDLENHLGFDLSQYNHPEKRKMLRNCVNPELGLHVLQSSRRTQRAADLPSAEAGQASLFNLEELQDVSRFGTASG